jgi:hypothetical protein
MKRTLILAAFIAGLAIVTLVTLVTLVRGARAGGYSAEERVGYVQRALSSLAELAAAGPADPAGTAGPARDRLETELALAARQRCGGGANQVPKLPCLIEVGAQLCQDARTAKLGTTPEICAAAVDVMLVNLRSAGEFVDEATRVRLVRSATDYHAALLAELRKRYAALAAELVIEDPDAAATSPASAASLDRFCARRDHRPKPPRCDQPSATCVPSLSWQRCVAALAWFVTSAPLKAGTP